MCNGVSLFHLKADWPQDELLLDSRQVLENYEKYLGNENYIIKGAVFIRKTYHKSILGKDGKMYLMVRTGIMMLSDGTWRIGQLKESMTTPAVVKISTWHK